MRLHLRRGRRNQAGLPAEGRRSGGVQARVSRAGDLPQNEPDGALGVAGPGLQVDHLLRGAGQDRLRVEIVWSDLQYLHEEPSRTIMV